MRKILSLAALAVLSISSLNANDFSKLKENPEKVNYILWAATFTCEKTINFYNDEYGTEFRSNRDFVYAAENDFRNQNVKVRNYKDGAGIFNGKVELTFFNTKEDCERFKKLYLKKQGKIK